MKYATWKVYFPEGSNEGSTADQEIVKRGGSAYGIGALDGAFYILGTYSEDSDVTNLTDWEFTPLSNEDALSLLQEHANQTLNSDDVITMLPDGTIIYPASDL